MKSSIYSIQEIEIQVFTTYFVCEDWRGICSLSDKILLMPLEIKTGFGVAAIQMYGTLNTIRHISTIMSMQVGSYLWHCMPLHSKLKQSLLWSLTHNHSFSGKHMILSYFWSNVFYCLKPSGVNQSCMCTLFWLWPLMFPLCLFRCWPFFNFLFL